MELQMGRGKRERLSLNYREVNMPLYVEESFEAAEKEEKARQKRAKHEVHFPRPCRRDPTTMPQLIRLRCASPVGARASIMDYTRTSHLGQCTSGTLLYLWLLRKGSQGFPATSHALWLLGRSLESNLS